MLLLDPQNILYSAPNLLFFEKQLFLVQSPIPSKGVSCFSVGGVRSLFRKSEIPAYGWGSFRMRSWPDLPKGQVVS